MFTDMSVHRFNGKDEKNAFEILKKPGDSATSR